MASARLVLGELVVPLPLPCSVLAILNLSGANLLLLQFMNALLSYMQTVAVVLRKARSIALLPLSACVSRVLSVN